MGLAQRVWRFPATQMVVEAVLLVALVAFGSAAMHPLTYWINPNPNTPPHFLGALVVAIAIVLAWKGMMRWIERAPDPCYPRTGAPAELGMGLVGGFLVFSTVVVIAAALGVVQFGGLRGGAGDIWPMLAVAVISGTFEELLFRGILFRHIETMMGTWWALALTSAFFGAAHLMNPGATWVAAVGIAVEAGILLGAAYMYTRRLWLAMGIHAAWNFTQGWVFSVPVSGGAAPHGLLITRRVGSALMTGGDFGLEASVVAMVVATAAGLVLLAAAVRRDGVAAPMWRRAA